MKPTRFAARDDGPAARVAGFMAHLRLNGFQLGVAETELALAALTQVQSSMADEARLALQCVCAGSADQAARFPSLFDAYWRNGGRVREKAVPQPSQNQPTDRMKNSRSADVPGTAAAAGGRIDAPDDGGDDEVEMGGEGKRVASRLANLMKKDLRDLVSPQDIREAERVAARLGAALRDRRSRRRKAARRGQGIDFRRTIRASLSTGGEPLRLHRKVRPEREVRIVTLCDVSGSMLIYARPFLAFLAGMMRSDPTSDAYLFHTRLTRISDALRDEDPLRALNRVTLLAEGMGGGSRIGTALAQFAARDARRFVNGRSVVVILSDGYDSDAPDVIENALVKLRKRGCRVIWLNPLKGWKGYAPVARAMAAALPHVDLFAAANTLADLAALEQELSRL